MKKWKCLGVILLVIAAVTFLGGCVGGTTSETTSSLNQTPTPAVHVVKVYTAPG
jgi:hypothetical protein